MKKIVIIVLALLISALFLGACSKMQDLKGDRGMMINYPEVKMKHGPTPEGVELPEIPEMQWSFQQEEGKTELTCKLSMNVLFKEHCKYNSEITFLDLNNFPVTTEKIKLIGEKGENRTYELKIYIDPKTSKRITKTQILLTPLQ